MQVRYGMGMVHGDRVRDDCPQRGGYLFGSRCSVGKKIGADEVRQRSSVLSGIGIFWQRLADNLSGFGDKPQVAVFAILRGSQELRFEQALLPRGWLTFCAIRE